MSYYEFSASHQKCYWGRDTVWYIPTRKVFFILPENRLLSPDLEHNSLCKDPLSLFFFDPTKLFIHTLICCRCPTTSLSRWSRGPLTGPPKLTYLFSLRHIPKSTSALSLFNFYFNHTPRLFTSCVLNFTFSNKNWRRQQCNPPIFVWPKWRKTLSFFLFWVSSDLLPVPSREKLSTEHVVNCAQTKFQQGSGHRATLWAFHGLNFKSQSRVFKYSQEVTSKRWILKPSISDMRRNMPNTHILKLLS